MIECITQSFSFRAGDPTLSGWGVTLGYFWTARLCSRTRKTTQQDAVFWGCLVVVMIALGLNKQLDLQSGLAATGRCLSKVQGWYEDRRPIQIAVVSAVILLTLILHVISALALRGIWHRIWLAQAGVMFLLCFAAIRVVSFHHIDALMNELILGWKFRYFLETTGIALIAANALLQRRRKPAMTRLTVYRRVL